MKAWGLSFFYCFIVFTFSTISGKTHAKTHATENCADDLLGKKLKVALVQYPLDTQKTLEGWEKKIHAYVAQAAEKEAKLVLFPELLSIEGLTLIDPKGENPAKAIRTLAKQYTPYFEKKMADWSRQYQITLVLGSWPEIVNEQQVKNTAFVFGPDGSPLHKQSKNNLTSWEVKEYELNGARKGAISFELPGNITAAIAICYDSEFPNYLPVHKGKIPEVVLVPSMTEDAYGRFRVARGSSARAVEFHSYVLVTGTVGGNASNPVLGAHSGQAKVYTPSDKSFPASGVLATGELNKSDILIAELDLETLRQSRKQSTTFPVKDLRKKGTS